MSGRWPGQSVATCSSERPPCPGRAPLTRAGWSASSDGQGVDVTRARGRDRGLDHACGQWGVTGIHGDDSALGATRPGGGEPRVDGTACAGSPPAGRRLLGFRDDADTGDPGSAAPSPGDDPADHPGQRAHGRDAHARRRGERAPGQQPVRHHGRPGVGRPQPGRREHPVDARVRPGVARPGRAARRGRARVLRRAVAPVLDRLDRPPEATAQGPGRGSSAASSRCSP